jgi:protein-disulfide isomerase
MRSKLETLITAALVACALTTSGIVVHREFVVPSRHAEQRPVLVSDWRDVLSKGMRLGPTAGPVQLIEFADFECPFCGSFEKTLKALRDRYPNQVALVYVHFPLPMHRFAMPAARVAACAGEQGRFDAMHDQLFREQDQFGLKPWDDYAKAAGVLDLAAFDACIKKTDPIPRVEEGKAIGAKLNVKGTPTVIINGWKLGRPPTEAELDQMVQRILAGKPPVDQKS